MSQTKETNIENRTLYIFDDMINIKNFGVNLFSYLGFVSRTFTNHRTASEGGGHSIKYLLITFTRFTDTCTLAG